MSSPSSAPAAILVTGSSRGLGRGVAETLAREGHSVAIHYVNNHAAAEAAAEACRKLATRPEQRFVTVGGNVGVTAERLRIVAETLAGLGRIDALVNNAGMAPRVRADVTETSEESFDEVLGVNLKGPYFLSQAVVKHWLADAQRGDARLPGGYKLVFVSSISAY